MKQEGAKQLATSPPAEAPFKEVIDTQEPLLLRSG